MASLNPFGGSLGRRRATHLLRRTTFGPTRSQIDQYENSTAAQVIAQLFSPVTDPQPPSDPTTGLPWNNPKPTEANSDEGDLLAYVRGWWLELMYKEGVSIKERMTYFLHTNFTTSVTTVRDSTAIYYQNALMRQYATGNFKELSTKMCMDNAMLYYLDGRLNREGNPNENFAREFLELYTIGKGPQIGPDDYTNYTEQDVQEAAKVLSGYVNDENYSTIDPDTGLATGYLEADAGLMATRHDATTKTFSSAFGGATVAPNQVVNNQCSTADALDELDQFVDMIFNQDETARHICRKLYRYFVYYDITAEVENDIIIPLANTFRNNNYEFQPVLEQLLNSEHFFDADNATVTDDNRGAIIKAPLDLVVNSMKFFQVTMPDSASDLNGAYEVAYRSLLGNMNDQGMSMYDPPEVAGYTAYHQTPEFNRNWISNNGLARRYQFSEVMLDDPADQGFQLDIVAFVENPQNISDPGNAQVLVQELIDDMFPEIITPERFSYFLDEVLLDNLSQANWAGEWNNYQISSDDTNVRIQLERLFHALIQSPEYQLY